MPKPKFGAFNQGDIPKIAVFNKATIPLGVDLDQLIAAMQVYINQFIVPVWATPANLVKSTGFIAGAWAMVFLDDADQPAKVFVRTTLQNGDLVSVSASHELVEMLVDPAINLMSTGPDPAIIYAYESADPVEALTFPVNGIPMSDFVYPAYFEVFRKAGSVKFDQLDKVTQPFQILSGGYQIIFKAGQWSQVFGSASKKKAFVAEDRREHRSQQRTKAQLERADLKEIAKEEAKAAAGLRGARKSGHSNAKARVLSRFNRRKRT